MSTTDHKPGWMTVDAVAATSCVCGGPSVIGTGSMHCSEKT